MCALRDWGPSVLPEEVVESFFEELRRTLIEFGTEYRKLLLHVLVEMRPYLNLA